MLHSVWARANAVFFFYVSGLAIIAGGCSLMFFVHESNCEVALTNVDCQRMRYVQKGIKSGEQAFLTFDMEADLTSEWNWDVKQLFLFVVARFETEGKSGSEPQIRETVIWDAIIQHEEDSVFRLRKQKAKYPIVDFRSKLRGTKVTLTLRWDIMPTVGMLKTGGGEKSNRFELTLPDTYM